MTTTKAEWRPGWYELDQPLEVGRRAQLAFLPPAVGATLVFYNKLWDPQKAVAARGTVVSISHPVLGQLEKVETDGLDYTFVLADGTRLPVDAEEKPGRRLVERADGWGRLHGWISAVFPAYPGFVKNTFAGLGLGGLFSAFVAVSCSEQIFVDQEATGGGGASTETAVASGTGGAGGTGSGTTTGTSSTSTGSGGGGAEATGGGGAEATGSGGAGGAGGVTWTPHGPCLAIGVVDPNVSTDWPNPNTAPNPATIDTITMMPWYENDYTPQNHMSIGTFGDAYVLSDGSAWESGAGSASYGTMSLDHISHQGSLIVYHMAVEDLIVERTDYDSGDHSAHFRLETLGDWAITATQGSSTGTLVAQAIIMMDEPANYVDSRFSYLSSPLCSVVPITITYSLINAVFDDDLFDGSFSYIDDIVVDAKSP